MSKEIRDKSEEPPSLLSLISYLLSLYQGDYLPDALYEEWAAPRRDHLRALFLRAATAYGEQLAEGGKGSGTTTSTSLLYLAERMLEIDPTYEPAYRIAIRAYRAAGQEALARQTYQRAVDALRDHLGVDPSPETTALTGG